MQPEEVKKQIQKTHPKSDITITVNNNGHMNIKIIDETFNGQSKVKRHQNVYRAIQELIASGALHAVNLMTMTPAEAETQDKTK